MWFIHWIKWLGLNSFTAIVIHNPIKGIVCVMVGVFLHCVTQTVGDNSFYSFVAFALTMIVTIMGICFVN